MIKNGSNDTEKPRKKQSLKTKQQYKQKYRRLSKSQPNERKKQVLIFTVEEKRSKEQLIWNLDEKLAFETAIKGDQDLHLMVQNYCIPKSDQERKKYTKKKYFFLYDSRKELNGYILNKPSSIINGRNFLKRDTDIIDYDQDSEEEVLDCMGDCCDSNESFSSEDSDIQLLEDRGFVIADLEINKDLLQEYGTINNFNQLQSQQINSGDYYPFYYTEQQTPELTQYFQRYCIVSIGKDCFPLVQKNDKKSSKKVKKNRSEIDPNDQFEQYSGVTQVQDMLKYSLSQQQSLKKFFKKKNPMSLNKKVFEIDEKPQI